MMQIAIYTGNDDNIINDLLSTYRFEINGKVVEKDIAADFLATGQSGLKELWKFTIPKLYKKKAVYIMMSWLTLKSQITDANAAFFDPAQSVQGMYFGNS